MLPNSAPDMKMEYNLVLSKALDRNSFAQNIRRRQLEADYEVATARGNLRSIDLFASVGYTGQDRDLTSAYKGLLDNQIVQVGEPAIAGKSPTRAQHNRLPAPQAAG